MKMERTVMTQERHHTDHTNKRMEAADEEMESLGLEDLSKKQRRKRLRYLHIAENRRLHRKEKKKEYKQRKKERAMQIQAQAKVLPAETGDSPGNQFQEDPALLTSAGNGAVVTTAGDQEVHMSKLECQKRIKTKLEKAMETGLRVVLDMSFGENMTQKEASRLAGQVGRVHGANKLCARPFHLYLTSLVQDGMLYRECVRRNDGFQHFMGVEQTAKHFLDVFEKKEIVYLSPDSPNDLLELDDDKVYIIGGLIDETVQKNVTITQATDKGLQTVRLPIELFMQQQPGSKGNKILTVNQVFEILLKFYVTRDWRIALPVGLPERKGFILRPDSSIPTDVLNKQGVFPPGYDKDSDWGEKTSGDSEEASSSSTRVISRQSPDVRKCADVDSKSTTYT